MIFDWSINLGHLITIALAIISMILAYSALKSDIRVLQMQAAATKQSVEDLDDKVDSLSQVLVTLGEQKTQIEMLTKLVDELRHGEGFVLSIPAYKGPKNG